METLAASTSLLINPGSVYSEPTITVYGSGEITLMVGTQIVELTDIEDSITLNTSLMEAYKGGPSTNSRMSGEFPVLKPGANAISWTGNVTKVEVQPNWRLFACLICVYESDCTDFSNNGLGAVTPMSCTVTETLNGEWELTLVHDIDEFGKWARLGEGRILRAPVPAAMTPRVKQVQAQPSGGAMIYCVSTRRDPLRLRSGTGTKYRILGKYKKGTQIVVLEKTTNDWYSRSPARTGSVGIWRRSIPDLCAHGKRAEQAAAVSEVIEPKMLRDQPFRIYRVVPELDKITVYARHIFYDLLDNMIQSLKPSSSQTGASVVQSLSAACLSEHGFTFYSDLESTAKEVEWENINPVEALLGEGGAAEKYSGELARDWFDVYLVQRVGTDTNVQIRQGKNLLGISYDVDGTNVTTRILPTGEDADGNRLYLPERYVDSPNLDRYPSPKWMHLEVSGAKEVKKGEGGKRSKAQCYEEMRSAGARRSSTRAATCPRSR